ncbi:MAG TPA: hypothetical protein DCG75_14410 [Bacteroidales bacterium]|nr:hypothetical protein [Bacteroidales bacterium]
MLLGAVILVTLSGLILAIKYYREKRFPMCSAVARNFVKYDKCNICGAESLEHCIKLENNVSKKIFKSK